MEKTLLTILSLSLLSLPLVTSAQVESDFTYTKNGAGVTITKYTGLGGDLTIPDVIDNLPVTCIGDEAFYAYAGTHTRLNKITIPDTVTNIGNLAFANCIWLTNIIIPRNVVNVGDGAISATSVSDIVIPRSVTNLGGNVFLHNQNLKTITVAPENPVYSSKNGVLFNKNYTTLLEYPVGRVGTYTIPASVTSVGKGAFYFCTNFTSFTIPSNVTNIGDSAFSYCKYLTSITLPGRIGNIGAYMFMECPLTTLSIPTTVTNIGEWAFYNCDKLVHIRIPSSVTSIGNKAFNSCEALNGIFFEGNAPSIGASVFENDNNAIVYYLTNTTGWEASFGNRPTVLWNPQVLASHPTFGVRENRFGFTIKGNTNSIVVVEACTNLSSSAWSPLQTNTLTDGFFYFNDTERANFPGRYYRLRWP